jgi:calcineurin-like phosphoesterase family protein
MTVWLTSHTLFNSETVISYENRPFESVKEMNESLIERWNARVSPQDSVIHLGKFAAGKKEEVIPIVRALKGKIFLLDGYSSLSMKDLLQLGFVGVAEEIVISYKNYSFCFSCQPKEALLYDGDHYFLNVYGGDGTQRRRANRFNAASKLWDFTPITLDDLLIEKRKTLK